MISVETDVFSFGKIFDWILLFISLQYKGDTQRVYST